MKISINENLGKIHFLEMIYNDEVNEIYKTHGYGMFYQGNEKNKIEHISKIEKSSLHTEQKYVLSKIFNNWFDIHYNNQKEKSNNNLNTEISIKNGDINKIEGDFFIFIYISPCYDCVDFYYKIQKKFPLLHFHIYFFTEYKNIQITTSLLNRKNCVFNSYTRKCKGTSGFCREQILNTNKLHEKYLQIINGEKRINSNISFQRIGPKVEENDFKKMKDFYLSLKNF